MTQNCQKIFGISCMLFCVDNDARLTDDHDHSTYVFVHLLMPETT